ncbi:MAG: TRAP transporter large permease [Hyphomicrobiales bacterium]
MSGPEIMCLAMVAAVCGLLLAGFPVALTLAGSAAWFAFIGYAAGMFDLTFLQALPSRLYTIMTREALVAVPLFVFMGVMLERSKVAEDLLVTMSRAFGNVSGGLAFAVTIVGMLLAASTGIVGATVVTLGLLALPTMLGRGYGAGFASGTVAASGTLGQIIPPSIILIFLGDQLSIAHQSAQFAQANPAPDSVSVNDLFAGALVPGLVLVGLYLAYQMFHVRAGAGRASGAVGREDADGAVSRGVFASLFAPLILIVAFLGSILAGLATPSEAASIGAVGAVLLAGYRMTPGRGQIMVAGASAFAALLLLTALVDLRVQRTVLSAVDWAAIAVAAVLTALGIAAVLSALATAFRARDEGGERILRQVIRTTLTITSMIFLIVIGASLFALVFRGFGGDRAIAAFLEDLPGGTLAAVALVMAVMFLLGFFLDFLEIVFVVVPVVAPVLLQMEMAPGTAMSPVWLGVMMAIVLQTSFLTPPFGFALFYLRGVAPDSVRTVEIYRGVAPFVAIQLLLLVVVWYLPGLATWLPDLLYRQ